MCGPDGPFEDDESAVQVASLLDELGTGPLSVLDLGCGDGRTLVPLVEAGHRVTGVDVDAEFLHACRARLSGEAAGRCELVEADFHEPWPDALPAPFDVVTCLGNTMMTVVDVDAARVLFGRVAAALRPGGRFIMDDCPHDYWPLLAEGSWQSGLAPDGDSQMVWAEADAVFAWRRGDDVDPASWTLKPTDRRLRLWTLGALRLAAGPSGLSETRRGAGGGLLIMSMGQP